GVGVGSGGGSGGVGSGGGSVGVGSGGGSVGVAFGVGFGVGFCVGFGVGFGAERGFGVVAPAQLPIPDVVPRPLFVPPPTLNFLAGNSPPDVNSSLESLRISWTFGTWIEPRASYAPRTSGYLITVR